MSDERTKSVKGRMYLFREALFFAGMSLVLILGGCAAKVQRGTPVPDATADRLWDKYVNYSDARGMESSPYRLRSSLRYGSEGDTRRVTVLIWGNGEETGQQAASGSAVRLDVMAGMNTLVARIRESPDGLIVYAPGENTAMVHDGSKRIVLRFGKPVPFTLRDFSSLMRGRFQEVFGSDRGTSPVSANEGTTVTYLAGEGAFAGAIELRADGLPVRWAQQGGWVMDISYSDAEGGRPPLPENITLVHPDGYSARVLVKDREVPTEPFSQKQLGLILPEGVAIETLKGKE